MRRSAPRRRRRARPGPFRTNAGDDLRRLRDEIDVLPLWTDIGIGRIQKNGDHAG